MNICSIAIGSEFLGSSKNDTNSLAISQALEAYGLSLSMKFICSDEPDSLGELFNFALERFDTIITIGGLGPTLDDQTRPIIAQATDKPLEFRQEQYDKLCQKFADRQRPMPDSNNRQAWFPKGSTALDNPLGTAEGIYLKADSAQIFCLPGPPREFHHMLEKEVLPRLIDPSDASSITRKTYRIFGIPESKADEILSDFFTQGRNPYAIFNCSPVDLEFMLVARGNLEESSQLIEQDEQELKSRLGLSLISTQNQRLPQALAQKLIQKQLTVAAVESISGGRIAKLLTQEAGSSQFFVSSDVTYQTKRKEQFLNHKLNTISSVSHECSQQLAEHGRITRHADLCIACTGWAGPTAEKEPVGTVYLSLATPTGTLNKKLHLSGDRNLVQERSAWWSLFLIWEWLHSTPNQ